MTAAPPMIRVRYFSKNVGSAATTRRGRFVDRLRVVVDRAGVAATGVGGGVDIVSIGAAAPSVVSSSASEVGTGFWGAGRGVTGRRERLATDWKSPVGAKARGARGRRRKAYGSRRIPAGPRPKWRFVTA